MQKKSNLQNCTWTHIVKRSSTKKEGVCVRSREALSEPVVVDVCFRTSSVQVIFALSSLSSSLSVSCSCSLGASSRVLSPSLVCVPSRSSSSVKMLRVLAPIIWSSTSLRCYCERMSIFLFFSIVVMRTVITQGNSITKALTFQPWASSFCRFSLIWISFTLTCLSSCWPENTTNTHYQTAIHLHLCASQCTRSKSFRRLLPDGQWFDCCTYCGAGSSLNVVHDVLESGRLTLCSLSFIPASLTTEILSNQWVFITAGSDHCCSTWSASRILISFLHPGSR